MEKIGNRYLIESQLEEEALFSAYQALDTKDNKKVTISILSQTAMKRPMENLFRFRKLVDQLKLIKHSNIEKVLDLGEDKNGIFIVNEARDHIILKDYKLTNADDIVQITIGLAQGLSEAHQSRILHGNINSNNILIKNNVREPVITRFGMSLLCDLSKISQKNEVKKFFGYLSPEGTGILKKPVDGRSDLYSLGIVFYELLTGKLPYDAEEVSELVHQHIAQEPVPPSRINPEITPMIEKIILRMIAKDPADRYQSADGLVYDLKAYLEIRKQGKEGRQINFEIARNDRLKELNFNTQLIGREKEVTLLRSCLNKISQEGKGKTFLIYGTPGIGKTRLVNELRSETQVYHGIFAEGKCIQNEFRTPYRIITEAVEIWLDKVKRLTQKEQEVISSKLLETLGQLGGEVVKITPKIKELIGEPPALLKLDSPDKEKLRFLMTVTDFICSLGSKENPLLLFMDDLQWVDEASLEILERLLPRIKDYPLLLILTFSSIDVNENHILIKMLDKIKLDNKFLCEEYSLQPLSIEEISRLLSQILLESKQYIEPLAKYLEDRTKGNPFFTLEMLRTLHEKKLINLSAEKHYVFDLNQLNSVDLPSNVIDIVLMRIKDLTPDKKSILSSASVMGKEINLDILKELTEKELEYLLAVMEEGINNQLIYRDLTGNEESFFIHDRVRKSFYEMLSQTVKMAIHKRIAEVMERNYSINLDDVIFDLAHHYTEGQVEDKALYYSIRGGDKAMNSYSYQLAAELYTSAKNILIKQEKTDTPEFINLLEKLGETQRLEGRYDEALASYKQCLKLVVQKIHKAKLLKCMGEICLRNGDTDNSLKCFEQGLALLGIKLPKSKAATYLSLLKEIIVQVFHTYFPGIFVRNKFRGKEKDTILMGIMGSLLLVLFFIDNMKALYLNVKNLNFCESMGKNHDMAWTYCTHSLILSCAGLLPRAKKYGEKGIQISKDIGDQLGEYCAYTYYGIYWQAANNPGKVIEYTEKSIGMLRNLGEVWGLALSYSFRGQSYLQNGDFKTAIECFENLLKTAREIEDARTIGIGLYSIEWVKINSGDVSDETFTNIKRAMNMLEECKDISSSKMALKLIGYAHMRRGEFKEAILCFEEVVKAINEKLLNSSWINDTQGLLAEACADYLLTENLSNKDRREILKKLKKACSAMEGLSKIHSAHAGLALEVKGSYEWLKGRISKAEKLWKKGLDYLRFNAGNPGGDKYRIAKILFQESKFSLQTDTGISSNELDRLKNNAHKKLLEAHDLFESMGCETDLKSVNQLLEKISPTAVVSDSREAFTAKRHLESLLFVTQAIGSVFKLEDLLEKIIEFALKVTGAECAFLMLYGENHALELKVSKGLGKELAGQPFSYENFRLSLELIKEVETRQLAMIFNQGMVEDKIVRELTNYQVKQAMAVPLKTKEKLIGILYLDNRLAGGTFGSEEQELMKAFSIQASVAIENTRLIGNLVGQERLKQEMRIAERIQTEILPEVPVHGELEISAVMKTATEVGGDYYDILPGKDNKLWFSIGDVTGHGVTPGLIMMMAQTAFSSYVPYTATPATALKAVNGVLYNNVKERLKEDDYFMTMLFLKYEGGGKFVCAGAGHTEPVIYRKSSNTCEVIDGGGVFLCLEKDNAKFVAEKKFILDKGDILFLYTDGITESRNKDDKNLWGDEKFQEAILKSVRQYQSLDDIKDSVLREALEWCGNQPHDDMTMVAVRMK